MTEPLATFTIAVPRYSRAFLPVEPYEDYSARLKELIPKEHFTRRLTVLQGLTRRKFPTPYWDIAFTVVVTVAVLSFAMVFFASFAGKIPVWYSICVVGALLTISAAYGMRTRKGVRLVSIFEATIAQELGSFTATDLPKYNVRWALTERPRRVEPSGVPTPPVFTISIFEYDPDTEPDELPAYVNARDYVQPVIIDVEPPGYELDEMRRERMERFVSGEPEDGANAGGRGGGGRRQIEEVLGGERRPAWGIPIIIDYASGEVQVGGLDAPRTDDTTAVDESLAVQTMAATTTTTATTTTASSSPPQYEQAITDSSRPSSSSPTATGLSPPASTEPNHDDTTGGL